MATGNIYIISAASGTGKTSLVHELIKQVPNVEMSISYTTREKRNGEKNGVDYFFVSEKEFGEMVEKRDFLEYAIVFNKNYGTSKSQIEKVLAEGKDVILEIDWQGAQQVRNRVEGTIGLFILPPSLKALKQRIIDRGQDSEEVVAHRLRAASSEISHYNEYDFLIVNDDFNQAVEDLKAVVLSQRYRLDKQSKNLKPLLDELLD